MALSNAAAMAAQHAAIKRQDTRAPLLINTDDARLMPNVPRILANPKYRVYHGDPKADLTARMAYLKSGGQGPARAVVAEDITPFDVNKASKDELIAFAANEYGADLDAGSDIRTLRKKVAELADAAGALA